MGRKGSLPSCFASSSGVMSPTAPAPMLSRSNGGCCGPRALKISSTRVVARKTAAAVAQRLFWARWRTEARLIIYAFFFSF